jgi:hypothetical protein
MSDYFFFEIFHPKFAPSRHCSKRMKLSILNQLKDDPPGSGMSQFGPFTFRRIPGQVLVRVLGLTFTQARAQRQPGQ